MPGRARAGLEGDAGAGDPGGIGTEQRVEIRTVPVNQSAGPLVEGSEPLRLMSMLVASFAIDR